MATSMTRQIVVNQEIAICSKYSNIIICEWFNNNRQIIVVSTEIKIDENTSLESSHPLVNNATMWLRWQNTLLFEEEFKSQHNYQITGLDFGKLLNCDSQNNVQFSLSSNDKNLRSFF